LKNGRNFSMIVGDSQPVMDQLVQPTFRRMRKEKPTEMLVHFMKE